MIFNTTSHVAGRLGSKTEQKREHLEKEHYESSHNSALKSQINTISVTNFTVLRVGCLWSNKAVFDYTHPSVFDVQPLMAILRQYV